MPVTIEAAHEADDALVAIPSVELVGGSKAPDAVVELISAGVNGGFNVRRRFVPVPSI